MINFANKDKATVLKALWENSKAQGMSFLHLPKSGTMSVAECAAALAKNPHVDYFAGKVIKVDFSSDSFDPWGYDRDNGEGAAAKVLQGV